MANFLAEQVEEQLVEHPAIQMNPVWKKMAEDACSKLADLYQAIGQEHFEETGTL
jgi:hypothetical protein